METRPSLQAEILAWKAAEKRIRKMKTNTKDFYPLEDRWHYFQTNEEGQRLRSENWEPMKKSLEHSIATEAPPAIEKEGQKLQSENWEPMKKSLELSIAAEALPAIEKQVQRLQNENREPLKKKKRRSTLPQIMLSVEIPRQLPFRCGELLYQEAMRLFSSWETTKKSLRSSPYSNLGNSSKQKKVWNPIY